ncbi:MAG: hypothetical protein GVY18_12195 [Bacteroidetes bacterium]|jgi:hypothetical protein|nr:hypothetical protein [Bacteroidota bacterium]
MKPFAAVLLTALLVLLAGCDSAGSDEDDSPLLRAEANMGNWTWIPVDGAQCRDGSATGLGVRLQEGATGLLIYLEGGGACFNDVTCATNPSFFGEAEFMARTAANGDDGIFSRTNPANPVGAWNAVYVPYCTGDVHAGDAPDTEVGFFGPQQFVGHRNLERYAALLGPYFADQEQILLTGASAGGFGTLIAYDLLAETFGATVGTENIVLLNDSGPIVRDDAVLAPSLQQTWFDLWNLGATLPDDFPALDPSGDGFEAVYAYYAETYPEATFGLLSHERDETTRFFFGFSAYDGNTVPPPVDAAAFEGALYDLRAALPDAWGTYYRAGTDHTFIGVDQRFYTETTDGATVADWLDDLLAGTATDVAPPVPATPAPAVRP